MTIAMHARQSQFGRVLIIILLEECELGPLERLHRSAVTVTITINDGKNKST
jgi:hypothetical protein